jgi:DNA-binding transcriptional LysR family regulator
MSLLASGARCSYRFSMMSVDQPPARLASCFERPAFSRWLAALCRPQCGVTSRQIAARSRSRSALGRSPPASRIDYVRLPHVLTSLRQGERGVVDDALAKLGLRRTVVLTTPRFLAVPPLVTRAPVVVTMHARLARLFAAERGLSLSPPPMELQDITVSLLWHASYDRDPAHAWLRQIMGRLVAEL